MEALPRYVPARTIRWCCMSKPDLPPCSVRDCKQAAGAIINGALLCGKHAVEELERLGPLRAGDANLIVYPKRDLL